jgi:hypothetical protein
MEVTDNEKSVAKIATHEPGEASTSEQQVTSMSSFFNDMNWLVPVSTAPTKRPLQPMGMIVLYVNGATKRLYIYNVVANAWYYTALT